MRQRIWSFQGDDVQHTVKLEHGYWSGKRIISVDEVTVHESRKIWDTGSEHRFDVCGQPCIIKIRNSPFSFDYELFVEGRLQ